MKMVTNTIVQAPWGISVGHSWFKGISFTESSCDDLLFSFDAQDEFVWPKREQGTLLFLP